MSKGKRKRRLGCIFLLILLAIGGGFGFWCYGEIAPMPEGASFYIRFEKPLTMQVALWRLHQKGVVRDVRVMKWYGILKRQPNQVNAGTYQFAPGMSASTIFAGLRKPIKQSVRIPETNLSYRTANLLQEHNVLDSADYKALIKTPEIFQADVSFKLPKTSLEGYLYPDTYDLPPLLGAKPTILKQLKAFGEKVVPKLDPNKNLQRTLTIASMVELEAMLDSDRPLIAGVIENRLQKKMRLQIDATVLYALGQWRRLTFHDYKATISPYNTYLHDGLPPGPICSPSLKSILAAQAPAHHEYLYYVAMPDGHHIFAKTYEEHLKNVAKARAARAKKEAGG